MDAYLFLNTEPGQARKVRDAVVGAGAARAVAVTGPYDVIARIEDVEADRLEALLCEGLAELGGVRSSVTSIVVDPKEIAFIDIPLPPLPFRARPSGLVGVVLVRVRPGLGRAVVRGLAKIDGIHGLAILTGEHDVMVEIAGDTIGSLAVSVLDAIHGIKGVESTTTMLVLSASAEAKS